MYSVPYCEGDQEQKQEMEEKKRREAMKIMEGGLAGILYSRSSNQSDALKLSQAFEVVTFWLLKSRSSLIWLRGKKGLAL